MMGLGGIALCIGVGVASFGIGLSANNSITGYVYGTMDANTAFQSFGRGVLGSIISGTLAAGAVFSSGKFGSMFLGLSILDKTIAGIDIGVAGGLLGYAHQFSFDRFLTGINQTFFLDAQKYLRTLHSTITRASIAYGIPSEIVACVLIAELLDYNAKDYFWDDTVWWEPEGHSLGIAQIRIDTARKWNLNGWDGGSPASEIRASLHHPEMAVSLLAELLSKINAKEAVPQSFNNWESLSDSLRETIINRFIGAKDDDHLSSYGMLTVCTEEAFKIVRKSNLFPPFSQ